MLATVPRRAVALALVCLLAAPALAAPPSVPLPAEPPGADEWAWSNADSPAGGPVQSVGGTASVLVASHWTGGTYRSVDGGRHWTGIEGFPDVVEARVVWDPSDAQRGYVAGFGGLARTTDGGATWTRPFDTVSYRADVSPTGRVAVTVRDDAWVNHVMVSDDGGATWTNWNAPAPPFTSVYGLTFGRDDDELLLMSISKLWRTTDAGATWTESDVGVALDLVRTDDGALWRAGGPLQRSLDGGATWTTVETPGEANPGLLGVRPGGLVAATAEGLLVTADGGATWAEVGFPGVAFGSTSLVTDPADPRAFFVTHESLGIVRIAPDGQGGWVAEGRTAGFPSVTVRTLGASADGSLLLAGGPLGLYASRDGGSSWEHTGAGMGTLGISATAATADGQVVYAGGQNMIFQNYLLVSRDGGRRFEFHSFNVGGDSWVVGAAAHPTDANRAWVAVQPEFGEGRVFETADQGRTWTSALGVAGQVFGVAYLESTGSLLAATTTGIRARDGLGEWTARSLGESHAVATGGGVAYAMGEGLRLWRTLPLPQGALFAPWAETDPPAALGVEADGAAVWAAVRNGPLLRCAGGPQGSCEDTELPQGSASSVLLSNGKVFAAGGPNGVWQAVQ